MIDTPLPIVTPRLILRPPVMGYVDCHEYCAVVAESFKELHAWVEWARFVPSIAQGEEYIRDCVINWILKTNNNVGLVFFIYERTSSRLVGAAMLHNIDWSLPRFEIGYWGRTAASKHGFITEAINAITRYTFLQLNAKRIEIRCDVNNIPSKKIPERLGYHLEGILKHYQYGVKSGSMTDVVVFSRINLTDMPELDVKWGAEYAVAPTKVSAAPKAPHSERESM